MSKPTTVLGCGRWGSFLAWYTQRQGCDVILWGRTESPALKRLKKDRRNEYLKLPKQIELTDSLEEAIAHGNNVLVAIAAQSLRELSRAISTLPVEGKSFVLCMKGLEARTGKRLTQVFREEVRQPANIAIWLGPGHVQDFVHGIPNCMIIGSDNIDTTKELVQLYGSDLIRFYYAQDLVGNEVGAAAKNVFGIAAGMLDGLKLCSLKGALMARGAREVSRLIRNMGGNELTAYGLCHIGDYEATLFSPHSQNRRFGESFVTNVEYTRLAEGVATAEALIRLSREHETELPISCAVHTIISEGAGAEQVLRELFLRPSTFEF